MAIKIDEQYVKQVNSIMSKLPQNPFIVDVVGKAIEISFKNRDVNKDYSVVLELADKAAEYTTANSSTTSRTTSCAIPPLLPLISWARWLLLLLPLSMECFRLG